jgi:hypothetical protein
MTLRNGSSLPQYTSHNKPEASNVQVEQQEEHATVPVKEAAEQSTAEPQQQEAQTPLKEEHVPTNEDEQEPENRLLGHRAQPEQMPHNFLEFS